MNLFTILIGSIVRVGVSTFLLALGAMYVSTDILQVPLPMMWFSLGVVLYFLVGLGFTIKANFDDGGDSAADICAGVVLCVGTYYSYVLINSYFPWYSASDCISYIVEQFKSVDSISRGVEVVFNYFFLMFAVAPMVYIMGAFKSIGLFIFKTEEFNQELTAAAAKQSAFDATERGQQIKADKATERNAKIFTNAVAREARNNATVKNALESLR